MAVSVATVLELDRHRPCRGQHRGHAVERAIAPHLRLLQDAVAGQGHEAQVGRVATFAGLDAVLLGLLYGGGEDADLPDQGAP